MTEYPDHAESLVALKRIEGQIRGIQKMVVDRKYCVDILHQIHAAISALSSVEDKILERHFAGCVSNAINGKSPAAKKQKMAEILQLISQFRKT